MIAYAAFAYPNPQQFFGSLPTNYDQTLISTLSTQGALAVAGGGCVGPNFSGLDTLGLSVVGGYSYGFPFISGIGNTLNGTGTFGFPNRTFGSPFGAGLGSVPFSGSTGLGSIFAGGYSAGYNTSLNTLGRFVGGGGAGPGGIAASVGPGSGGPFILGAPTGGRVAGDIFTNTGCNVRI
jgi:hypothetical protein